MKGFTLLEEIQATAEMAGAEPSAIMARMLIEELKAYPEDAIRAALAVCRQNLRGRLTLQEIIIRIPDGRPGPEQAWAMLVWDDRITSVLTQEMATAQGIVTSLHLSGDRIGAGRAFREAYTTLVNESRLRRERVRWHISLGYDLASREAAIRESVANGRISQREAQRLLPEAPGGALAEFVLTAGQVVKSIPAADGQAVDGDRYRVSHTSGEVVEANEDRAPGWMQRRLRREMEAAFERKRQEEAKAKNNSENDDETP